MMDKHAVWKWLILLVLVAGSLVVVSPPLDKKDDEGLVVHPGKIRFGLDLKGGSSFAVQVDVARIKEDIRARSRNITDEALEKEVARILAGAQERTLEVLRNRIDSLGITEPIIYPGQNDRIIIQLPGVDEAQRAEAKRNITSAAFLEFRMVHENNAELVDALFANNKTPEGYRPVSLGAGRNFERDPTFPDEKMDRPYRERLGRFEVPDSGHEFLLEKSDDEGQTVFRPYFVKRRRELSGEFLKDASVDFQSLGQAVVKIEFDSKGAKKFASVTADYAPGGARNPNPNTYRQLAIVLDDKLYSAPRINEPIFGGRAEISGSFTVPEANFLANILRAGSLPAPVEIVEERFVAPSLGADAIRSGVRAVVYGGIGVLAFMLIYYSLCGVIANIALLLNMILLPLGMIVAAGFLGIFARDAAGGGPIQLPVLTLPGIAGILLTIGMAVDANVLIFERIREESVVGKRLWTAITAGYDRAFVTITDANVTTLLTGVILFVFGSGPIRGFAVTLCAGIMVSMFTALVVTRLFFGIIASKTNIKSLKMLSVIKDTAVDFVGKRKIAAIASLLVIVVSWGFLVAKGVSSPGNVFGVDFTGGASVSFTYEDQVPVEQIRETLEGAGVSDAHIQYQTQIGSDEGFLLVKTGVTLVGDAKPAEVVKSVLPEAFREAGLSVAQEDEVGAMVGSELKRRAVWSIVLALLGIVIYVSWRFELGFAVGAIAALAHDVLLTVGVYCLFGRQISLPIVAALLTIVGYSVNDTIVVFDRIREDLKLVRNKSFKEICNLSINQTLSRTLLTSVTTLITVVMLLIFGGGAINDFALALCIGVIVGTYSSIFVATPVVLLWHKDRKPEFAMTTKN